MFAFPAVSPTRDRLERPPRAHRGECIEGRGEKGGGEAHIVLQPESLGHVKLDLRLHGQEVNTFMTVDSQAATDMITSRLNVLEQSLLQHGLALGSFQVEVRDGGRGFGEEPRGNGNGIEPRELEALETEVPNYDLPWMSTLVNLVV